MNKITDFALARRQTLVAAIYAAVLLWVNAYICRDLFSAATAYMNSMHGFWTAMAKFGGDSWFHAAWWPYWDCGIPFEYTYAPLVPGMAAAWAAIRGIPHAAAFHCVTGFFYCLGPLTLFAMAWRLTGAAGYSFFAALAYSITSPTQILAPDGEFAFFKLGDARRLFLLSTWDDTPHYAAVALLPLVILFLARSIETRKPGYYAAASFCVGLAALASVFGPVMVVMAAACLLFVLRREDYLKNMALTVGIGAYGWAISAFFLSPTLLRAIHESSANSDEEGWTVGSLTALAIMMVGWAIVWHLLRRVTKDWRTQFFALFAWLTTSLPLIATYAHRHFLPQPNRYKFEAEMAISLLVVFGSRWWFDKIPLPIRKTIVLLLLALAGEQVVNYRKFEKMILFPRDITATVEYRAATWAGQNLNGTRVFLPGSVAMWADAFAPVQQFAGGAFSMAYNQVQQNGNAAIVFGGGTAQEDARLSLTWLKAFGVGAVGMSSKESQEYWKPFSHPAKFDGVLPVLWSQDGVTIYKVTGRPGLAHVVPEASIVRHEPKVPEDVAEVEKFVAGLDNPAMPDARFEWQGRNRIVVHADRAAGQVVAVQVSYHPGWHASVAGQARPLKKDGLGLMWLRPECAGPCEILLDYDGGWELRVSRWITYAALAGLVGFGVVRWKRRGQTSAGSPMLQSLIM
jgi:hypothetical protein